MKQKLNQPSSRFQGARTKYHPGKTVPFEIEQKDELLPERVGNVPTMHPLGLLGNVDPITGRPLRSDSDEQRGEESSGPRGGEARVGVWLGDTVSLLQELLAYQKAIIPVTTCVIDGLATIPAGASIEYRFLLDSKPVPALQLQLQNNTSAILYFNFNLPAALGTFQLAPSQSFNSRVMVASISLYTVGSTNVTGVRNTAATTVNGIVLAAWSNPEWKDMWGNI